MAAFVRLLGRPWVEADGRRWEPSADRRSALLYVLAHAGGWVSREDALLLFWPDSEERKARVNLRQLLVATRALPFAGGLEAERSRLRWPVVTDLARWRDPPQDDDAGPADPWPGPLLDGFRLAGAPEFESWLELERTAWDDRVRAHVLGGAVTHLRSGRADHAAASLDRWLIDHPLDEEALRAWMEVSARLGSRTAVLERFAAFQRRLEDEIGVAPEPATAALAATLRSGEALVAGDAATEAAWSAALPAVHRPRARPRRADLIGRADELAQLEAMLTDAGGAVVTLVAPGGMGKTRLALEAVAQLRHRFRDGCAVAFLATATEAAEAAGPIADALGIRLAAGGDALAQLKALLADRHLLVLLDNVEQIAGIAEFLADVQRVAPRVAWLLTSRRRIDAPGEGVLELGALALPGDEQGAALASVPAVALLMKRARDAGVAIDLERLGAALRRVVRATGGMPLALELAAGWLRVRAPDALADAFEAGLDAFEALDDGVEPRHRALRAMFDASWQALAPRERAALRRLATFRDGFVEEAAREVADVGLPLLLVLRHKSFLGLAEDGRFRPHPLLEVYVRERAEEDALAWAEARDRHADWFGAYLTRWELAGQEDQEARAIAMLQAEHANLEAAWAWAVDTERWHVLRDGGALFCMSYVSCGRPERWQELMRAALARVPEGSVVWAVLETHEASTDLWAGDGERGFERRSRALEALRAGDDPYALAWGLVLWAFAAGNIGRWVEACRGCDEAAARFEALGLYHHAVMVRVGRYACSTDAAERERRFAEVVAAAERVGSRDYVADIQQEHARFLAQAFGAYGAAAVLADAALAYERTKGDVMWVAGALIGAAEHRLAGGDLAAAERLAREALARARQQETVRPFLADAARVQLARIARLRGDAAAAHDLLPADGRAAATVPGLTVRARLALEAGDLVNARGCADQALGRVAPDRAGPDAERARVDAWICSAEVAVAMQEWGLAVRDLDRTLEAVVAARLLPLLLHAVTVAFPLVSDEAERSRLRAWVARHPATSFAVRRRVAGGQGAAPDAAPVTGAAAEALWDEALREADAVREALRAFVGDGMERARTADRVPQVN